jgi:putative ABC transport system substrate-binding protein
MSEAQEVSSVNRRDFITLLGGGVAAWPLTARAQQADRIYRLAFVSANPREASQHMALLDELRRYGFVEGQNLIVDQRGFSTDYDKFPAVAAAIVKAPVDAIVCSGEIALRATQQATRAVPILGVADDMLAAGLVGSLARPGGNTTGISILATELDGKRQELLMEILPNARRMAALADPNSTEAGRLQRLKDGARAASVELSIHMVDSAEKIVAAIDQAKDSGAHAINFLSSPLFTSNRHTIIQHVIALRLPSIHHLPEIVEDGGLVGYGARITAMYRQMARLLVKVLRGTAPADLPVEQPATFELVFNLKTAAAIGLVVPPSLLLRADKVIE